MMTSTTPVSHVRTVVLTILAVILVVPVTLLIGIAWWWSGVPLPGEDLSTSWLPYPLDYVMIRVVGGALFGFSAGALAFYAAAKVVRGASHIAAAYGAAAVIGTLTACMIAILYVHGQDLVTQVPSTIQCAGILAGLVVAGSGAFETS